MAKRSDHSGGTALKTRPRAGRIVLWALLAALLLGAVIGVVSLLRRPSGAETPENTAAPTAAPDTSAPPPETPLPEELREAPLSPAAEIAGRAAVRSNGFPMLAWAPDGFSADERGRMQYSGGKYLTGIDVSEHQYDIDWEKVAADGIDFAMIRVGYRGSTAGKIYMDEYFEQNIAGATAAGLKVGVYFYSQAINAGEAAEEAAFVLDAIRPYKVTFPVVFDWEIVGGSDARTYTVSRAVLCESAKTFCDAVEDAGYDAMIYFTQYLGYRKYILRQLSDYEFWYAEYEAKPRIVFNFDMWQYSSTGSVNGIEGDVDLNLAFFRK